MLNAHVCSMINLLINHIILNAHAGYELSTHKCTQISVFINLIWSTVSRTDTVKIMLVQTLFSKTRLKNRNSLE